MVQRNNTRVSNQNPEVLKQKIIHYKSELARFKQKINDYENNYYYSLIDQLKQENAAIKEQYELAKMDWYEKKVTMEQELERLQSEYDAYKQKAGEEIIYIKEQRQKAESSLAENKEKQEMQLRMLEQETETLVEKLKFLQQEKQVLAEKWQSQEQENKELLKRIGVLEQEKNEIKEKQLASIEKQTETATSKNLANQEGWFLRNLKQEEAIEKSENISEAEVVEENRSVKINPFTFGEQKKE